MRQFVILCLLTISFCPFGYTKVDLATPAVGEVTSPEPVENLFVKHFYMNPDQRLKHETVESKGFVLVESPNKKLNSRFAIVTDFGGNVLKTQSVPGLMAAQDSRKWIKEHLETAETAGVEIRRLEFPGSEEADPARRIYWVGHRAYRSADEAVEAIKKVRYLAERKGHDFSAMVAEAATAMQLPDEEEIVDIKPEPQFISEEKLFLKYFDQMNIGTKLYGPFHGEPAGEPLIWQSFGETSWRQTNFESPNFHSQVGFWTNRFVFKGIRAPLNTVDPYLESTKVLESVGVEFKSFMQLWAGLEWRPFAQNPWLENFRPWGGISILQWIRNYRIFLQYGLRENLKGDIEASDNHDMHFGAQIFYEWGVELPALDEPRPSKFSEYVEQYIWGEYFGNYRYEMTNFSSEEDFDAVVLNSSVILGVKLPGIPLPPNPINDELVLMPYMRFEHVNNSDFSFAFQNRYFLAAGVRWMPFRTYRHKENEWLSKTKVFIEYVGVGKTQHAKQSIDEGGEIRYDLRVGVNISSRRY